MRGFKDRYSSATQMSYSLDLRQWVVSSLDQGGQITRFDWDVQS